MPDPLLKSMIAVHRFIESDDRLAHASKLVARRRDEAKRSIGTQNEATAHRAWAEAEQQLRLIGKQRLVARAECIVANSHAMDHHTNLQRVLH